LRPGLVELGIISYGVYLIHAFVVLAFLRTDWGRDLIPLAHGGVVAFFVHAGVVLAITLPLAWISWHALERPILVRAVALADRWQERRRGRRARASAARS
jgi:peptidoglycan/LPS O-acetylase OafA/YrhL